MTQLNTADPAEVSEQVPAETSPEQAPQTQAPETASPPAAEQRPDPPVEDFVRVPKDQLTGHNGSWHEVMSEAKTGKQFAELAKKFGMTTEQALAHVQGGDPQQAPTAGTGPEGQGQPLDPDKLRQGIVKDVFGEMDQRDQQRAEAQTKARQEAYERAGKSTRQELHNKLLEKLKIKPDDYRAELIGLLAQKAAKDTVLAALKSDPRYKGRDLGPEANMAPLLAQEQATALEAATKMWTDLGNEFVSAGVTAQQGVPAATLAGGAGSPSKPPVNMDGWTEEERASFYVNGTRK